MTWTKTKWINKRRSLEAYSPDWKRGKKPFAVLRKSPRKKRRRGAPAQHQNLESAWPYIELKARAAMLVEHGTSEREAIALAMLDMGWKPATAKEIDRVRSVLRRMVGSHSTTELCPTDFADKFGPMHNIYVLQHQREHTCQSQQSMKSRGRRCRISRSLAQPRSLADRRRTFTP